MGHVDAQASTGPRAIELQLPWGPVVRGLTWGTAPDSVVLLHEPGADVDAWGTLPGLIARALEQETIALDLPGHGLSDDPWELVRVEELVRFLVRREETLAGRQFLIAAGSIAYSALTLAADLQLAGLVCLSPLRSPDMPPFVRSPRVPKLLISGSLAGDDLDTARQLASASGGWAVVTSVPVEARGTALLRSDWRGRVAEEIVTFLRDCQRRPIRHGHLLAAPRSDSNPG